MKPIKPEILRDISSIDEGMKVLVRATEQVLNAVARTKPNGGELGMEMARMYGQCLATVIAHTVKEEYALPCTTEIVAEFAKTMGHMVPKGQREIAKSREKLQ